jgi:hypothetical protein
MYSPWFLKVPEGLKLLFKNQQGTERSRRTEQAESDKHREGDSGGDVRLVDAGKMFRADTALVWPIACAAAAVTLHQQRQLLKTVATETPSADFEDALRQQQRQQHQQQHLKLLTQHQWQQQRQPQQQSPPTQTKTAAAAHSPATGSGGWETMGTDVFEGAVPCGAAAALLAPGLPHQPTAADGSRGAGQQDAVGPDPIAFEALDCAFRLAKNKCFTPSLKSPPFGRMHLGAFLYCLS